MMFTTKMNAKGQITIPKQIRDAIGAKAGTIFRITVKHGNIVLTKIDNESHLQLSKKAKNSIALAKKQVKQGQFYTEAEARRQLGT